jgi:hypothetical protein
LLLGCFLRSILCFLLLVFYIAIGHSLMIFFVSSFRLPSFLSFSFLVFLCLPFCFF